MEPIKSNDDFKAMLVEFARSRGIKGAVELGREIGVPKGTASQWLYTGLESEKGRTRVVRNYPQIFAHSNGAAQGESPAPDSATDAKPPGSNREIAVLVKIEQARSEVAALAALLQWFLYESTETERNLFRDELGEGWEKFQQLARAMHGETAFKIAREEGRL